MKRLHLVLNFAWYDETVSGRKRVEYREKTDKAGNPTKWKRQIWDQREKLTHVRFQRGYSTETETYRITKIDEGTCPLLGWDGRYYRIHFCDE